MAKPERYSLPMMSLHWIIAVLIVAAFSLGTIMTDMKISPAKLKYYSYHKWLGVTILALVALRLIIRLFSKVPDSPEHMGQWQKKAANYTHALLYMLMFAVPLSGYFYTSAAGYPVVYLGLFELPTIITANPELKNNLKELHELLTNVMLVVVVLHILAAFKHQFLDKDKLIQRMMPGQ